MMNHPTKFIGSKVFQTINGESLILSAGLRAVLLEIAHPLIAQGVADHSDFQKRPLHRLWRTLLTMGMLTMGVPRSAKYGKRSLGRCHATVQGVLQETAGPFIAGTPYNANDPHLRLWVYATLIDSSVVAYENLVRPLSEQEKNVYYEDVLNLAEWVGVPQAILPTHWQNFSAYVNATLHSSVLTIGQPAQKIYHALLYGHPFAPFIRQAGLLSLAWTPAHLRQQFGIAWTAEQSQKAVRWQSRIRYWRTHSPRLFWQSPIMQYAIWRDRWLIANAQPT
ncbi:MAG TPA: oxygenase MpaB family protein [Anaerolineales bacterium]|nr:oxygenase MpaB family protein [Anaerolineales bacterium]